MKLFLTQIPQFRLFVFKLLLQSFNLLSFFPLFIYHLCGMLCVAHNSYLLGSNKFFEVFCSSLKIVPKPPKPCPLKGLITVSQNGFPHNFPPWLGTSKYIYICTRCFVLEQPWLQIHIRCKSEFKRFKNLLVLFCASITNCSWTERGKKKKKTC